MSEHQFPLPTDVHAALLRGEIVEAIKLLRHATGIGLKEAKDIIEAHNAGLPVSLPKPRVETTALRQLPASGELPEQVLATLARDGKIAAIKQLRELTGLGLKEAKDAVEAAPQPPPRAGTVMSGSGGGGKLAAMLVLVVVGAIAGLWFAGVF